MHTPTNVSDNISILRSITCHWLLVGQLRCSFWWQGVMVMSSRHEKCWLAALFGEYELWTDWLGILFSKVLIWFDVCVLWFYKFIYENKSFFLYFVWVKFSTRFNSLSNQYRSETLHHFFQLLSLSLQKATLKDQCLFWSVLQSWSMHGLRSSWSHQLTVFQRVDKLSVLAREDGARQV